MTPRQITGSEALAHGALEAGVRFVTGYPGSPSTATMEALLRLQRSSPRTEAENELHVEWAINEKSAFDAAFGASLAGVRSLLCVKSMGLNVALDSLMVSNLAAGDGGFVILVGDDPGGWGSQNEEDSRLLASAAEVPLLEPTAHAQAGLAMVAAFDLSAQYRLPVVLRIIRALSLERGEPIPRLAATTPGRIARFRPQPLRFNVLPIHVVDLHRKLQASVNSVGAEFEQSPLNAEYGQGRRGIIAAGFTHHKLAEVLAQSGQPPLRILRLSTLHPLPAVRIARFLGEVDAALVLEETAPYIETQVQAIAQRSGLTLPIYGRSSNHVPGTGELFAQEIAQALTALLPAWSWPSFDSTGRTMPSRQPLCDDCPYIPALEALLAVMERHGGRDSFIVTGETGCMVRAQLPPWEILDAKYGMGSSIGLAAGLARTGLPQRIIALSGDSALLHSGLGELIDAAQAGISLLVVILANAVTALSGGQPHPASHRDAQGRPRKPLDLAALITAAGVDQVRIVDPEDAVDTQDAFEEGLASGRLAVVVARRACPRWAGEPEG